MKFELGKCYRHTTKLEMKVIGIVDSTMYELGFLSENSRSEFSVCGMKEENAIGWEEITNKEWMKNFSSEV